jgi:hypothetical protein
MGFAKTEVSWSMNPSGLSELDSTGMWRLRDMYRLGN